MAAPQLLAVTVDNDLLTLNRAVGILRRQRVSLESLAVCPTESPAAARLTVQVGADPETAQLIVRQLKRVTGVHEVWLHPAGGTAAQELALFRVRAAAEQRSQLLDMIAVYGALILEDDDELLVTALSGSPMLLQAFVRALEPFGLLATARSGAVVLPPSEPALVARQP